MFYLWTTSTKPREPDIEGKLLKSISLLICWHPHHCWGRRGSTRSPTLCHRCRRRWPKARRRRCGDTTPGRRSSSTCFSLNRWFAVSDRNRRDSGCHEVLHPTTTTTSKPKKILTSSQTKTNGKWSVLRTCRAKCCIAPSAYSNSCIAGSFLVYCALFNRIKAIIKASANCYRVITKTLYITVNWYINGDVSMA